MRREVLLDSFVKTKQSVMSLEEAADAMGVSFAALEKGLERARAAGDKRGVYTPLAIKRPIDRAAKRKDLLQRWSVLPTMTDAEAAKRLGTTVAALRSARSRVRRDGLFIEPDTDQLLDDWAHLRDSGEFWERAAPRLGLSRSAMHDLLQHARAAGDDRGRLS